MVVEGKKEYVLVAPWLHLISWLILVNLTYQFFFSDDEQNTGNKQAKRTECASWSRNSPLVDNESKEGDVVEVAMGCRYINNIIRCISVEKTFITIGIIPSYLLRHSLFFTYSTPPPSPSLCNVINQRPPRDSSHPMNKELNFNVNRLSLCRIIVFHRCLIF